MQADRSGRLREWLDTLDRRRALVGSSMLTGGAETSALLSSITEELHDVRRRVMALTSM